MKTSIPAVVLMVLLITSCRFDYGETPSPEDDQQRPDFTLRELDYGVVLGDGSQIKFIARKGDFHEQQHSTELQEVTFHQYSPEGELLTLGWSNEAVIDLHTEDALLLGSVVIHALDEDLIITADQLFWHRSDQVLSAPAEALVTMEQTHGTMTRGRGFTADLYRREFRFTDEVRGELNESP